VVGFHAYATAGAFTIDVAVSFYEEGSMVPDRLDVNSAATVSDAQLIGTDGGAFQAFQGVPYAGEVATFSDANPFGTWADYAATIDDPKVYTRPWTVSMNQEIRLDTDLVDEFCIENEKSSQRLVGAK
jgi:hypothetical protein